MRKTLSFVATLLLAVSASAQLYPAKPQPADFAPAASKNSKIFVVDPVNGSNTNSCLSFEQPCADLASAYAKTTSGHNDTVLFVAGATASYPSAKIAWSNNYTHLIGISSPLPGMGQRARVVGNSTNDLVAVIEFSGSGCIVKNIQFYNGADNAANNGAAIVSGDRNYFENVFFAGMGDATASGAQTRAGGYSLTLSGSENTFKDCTIGLDTIVRSAANAELVVSGTASRNRFIHSDFISASETTGKFLVSITGMDRDLIFENCLFRNFSANWAASLTDAIHDGVSTTHYVILRGQNQLVGVSGFGDTVTHFYLAAPVPAAGAGVSTQPTT
jgi:hypothetical protein